jgi:prepilin-type N-terminal cleavage/methylation domain-containing protein
MSEHQKNRHGFTLIELMMVVAILGVLAAVAIPTFTFFLRRAKSAEAASNLNMMFKSAASYYMAERTEEGVGAATSGFCTIGDAGPRPATPMQEKQKFTTDSAFQVLGFAIADYVYYSYGVTSGGAGCSHTGGEADLYTFYANGDLDADTVMSTFELAAGSDDSNQLYHAYGLHVVNETE